MILMCILRKKENVAYRSSMTDMVLSLQETYFLLQSYAELSIPINYLQSKVQTNETNEITMWENLYEFLSLNMATEFYFPWNLSLIS
jgi:hypothetical protein